jgi:hypothetical protein
MYFSVCAARIFIKEEERCGIMEMERVVIS